MRQNVASSLLEELHIESSAWVIEVHSVGFLAFSRCKVYGKTGNPFSIYVLQLGAKIYRELLSWFSSRSSVLTLCHVSRVRLLGDNGGTCLMHS